jgi:hypothetical protein
MLIVPIGIKGRGVVRHKTRAQHDGAHIQCQVPLLIVKLDCLGGTEFLAGAALVLQEIDAVFGINGIFEGDGLGIFYIGGLSFGKSLVELVPDLFWAFFGTEPASDTALQVNVTGMLGNLYLEISRFPRDTLHFRKGEYLDVDVPADLDQFWRDNSHGTFVGGKGLVELAHDPANGSGPFHQVDIISGLGQVQGRLHSRDTSAHHQYGPYFSFLHIFICAHL